MLDLRHRLTDCQTIIFYVFLLLSKTTLAAEQVHQGSGIISYISNELVLSLQDKNTKIELANIYIPNDFKALALEKLNRTLLNKQVNYYSLSNKLNRHGNLFTNMTLDRLSIQEELLKSGLALVYIMEKANNTQSLFAAEELGRRSHSGIWYSTNSSIINNSDITNHYEEKLNQFLTIEGVVDNIFTSKKNTYINFGKDWHTDFTIQLENKLLKQAPEFNCNKLKRRKIRVRGWLEKYNGPFMKIFNTDNIEIID